MNSLQLAEGIQYTECLDSKSRSCFLALHFYIPRNEQTAPVHALLADLLTTASADYPTVSAMTLQLDSLYAADFAAKVKLFGDTAVLIFTGTWMDDRFSLHGEDITGQMLQLICNSLLHPLAEQNAFRDPVFQICKQNLMDDIDCVLNSKRRYAMLRAAAICYEGEPAAIPSTGTTDAAAAITPAFAYQVWQDILHHAPLDIISVLPAEKPQVRQLLQDTFGHMPRPARRGTLLAPSPCKVIPRCCKEEMAITQSKLVMVFKYHNVSRDVMHMLNGILSGISDSLLFRNVREEKGLCYYCSSQLSSAKGTLSIDCGTERPDAVRKAVLEQITALQQGDFTEEMMAEVILHDEYVNATISDSPEGLAGYIFSGRLFDDTRPPSEHIADYRRVTKTQIMAAAASLRLDTEFLLSPEEVPAT